MRKILSIIFILGITVTTFNYADTSFATTTTITSPITPIQQAVVVKPIDLVNNPSAYIHRRVSMTAKFAKFSTLGLDYNRAMRSSDNYISFLFLRDDAINNIPLSELKMFINRKTAEKLPDIDEGDTVKVTGTVFSNALGDVWFDAESLNIVNKIKKDDTKK